MEMRDSAKRPHDLVSLTIVGGRPSKEESSARGIPRGLEVLLKKASVDEEFRASFLEKRSRAAEAILLELDPAEAAMLDSMPREQLEAIIRGTRVPAEDRRIFLGQAASVMLAALGAGVSCISGCSKGIQPDRPRSAGIRPNRVEKARPADAPARAEANAPDSPRNAPSGQQE